MATPVLGSANLFALVPEHSVDPVLGAAWDAGFRDFDTAPSYGFGHSEIAVGRFLTAHADEVRSITTKVGIGALPPPGRAVRAAKAVARRLPARVQDRVRGDGPPGGGCFGVEDVRASVAQSLRRLPRIDRLVLHEVTPGDITPELLETLDAFVARGDVGLLGVATSPERTAPALARGSGRFGVAHHSVAPGADRPPLEAGVLRVGHGALGAGGAALAALDRARRDAGWSARWDSALDDRGWSGLDPAGVLLALAGAHPDLDALIVATSRPERLARMFELVSAATAPGVVVADLVDEAVRTA